MLTRNSRLILPVLQLIALALMASSALGQTTKLVSVNSSGTATANGGGGVAGISADGRFVAFGSGATDLVTVPDNNNESDIFVRDLLTNTTKLVSINSAGTGTGNRGADSISISADFRFVAFLSWATDLVTTLDNNNGPDAFVRDLLTNTTKLVSINSSGTATARIGSYPPQISADGRFVAFRSWGGTDLVPVPDNNNRADVFVRDLLTNTTKLVSINSSGTATGNGDIINEPVINANGRFVVFQSDATDLVTIPDSNNTGDIFVRDLLTNTTKLVSINSSGTATGNNYHFLSGISNDGRFVVFQSEATDLVTIPDSNNYFDIFVRDLLTNTTKLVSINSSGTAAGNLLSSFPNISADGRSVAFWSDATDLVTTPDFNFGFDIFVRDLQTNTTKLVSINSAGNGTCTAGPPGIVIFTSSPNGRRISADGQFVAFQSICIDLVTTPDNNNGSDTFVRDLKTNTTKLVSVNSSGTATANQPPERIAQEASGGGIFSADGRFLAFGSSATDLVTIPDNNNALDTFVFGPLRAAPNVQFSSATYSGDEGAGSATIMVTRSGDTSGDTSGSATVNYATSDSAGLNNCNVLNTGNASARCDYETTIGTLRFAAGETSKTIAIPIVDDSYAEGSEAFTVTLSNPTGAALGTPATTTVTVNDNDPVNGTNPIEQASFFVRQHYIDFLNREPDPSGLDFWTHQIIDCGNDQQCIEIKRINVSAAFYLSIEFQETGYLVERIYKAAYGDATGTSTLGGTHQLSVPVVRLNEFLPDTQEIGQGVIVGQPGWEQVLENNKQAFTAEFVQRSRFTSAFPMSMTAAQFVDKLNTNAGSPLSQSERDQLVNDLATNAKTRWQVLRAVAEDQDLKNAEFNRAFVLMQYFGYLRRNPNDPQDTDYTGYDFWLTKLNQFNGNFINAEMVKAFIVSGEYRSRFGP
jgi:hypothetical protein